MRMMMLAILMVFGSSTFAQDVKYDSAIISYYLPLHKLYISINGQEYIEDTTGSHYNTENAESLHPFISKIQQWEKRDWLCVDIKSTLAPTGSRAYLAYLRRKKE